LEQPPLNLKDHFFQRRRWILGTMQNLQKFPRMHRYKLMFKSITYFLGFASAAASAAFSINNYLPMLISPSYLNYNIVAWHDKITTFSLDTITNSIASTTPLELGVAPVMLFTSLVWLSSYQMGLFLNLRYSKIKWAKRLLFHVQTLFLSPLIGLVETFPAFWATIEYLVKKQKTAEKVPVYDFYVISK
jgi:cellulose synthase/poly-beta-1,6-N-acetylglucosamine synthase-like glycosyltransferase